MSIFGLSLCVQGTFNYNSPSFTPNRFIPVCTGNISIMHPNFKLLTVYPCVYREHRYSEIAERGHSGLSLCVQGT